MAAAAPVFASASEAMAMVHAALGYLAQADATVMTARERARCLRELEQADAVATAARTSGRHLVNKPDRDCGRQAVREPAHQTSNATTRP